MLDIKDIYSQTLLSRQVPPFIPVPGGVFTPPIFPYPPVIIYPTPIYPPILGPIPGPVPNPTRIRSCYNTSELTEFNKFIEFDDNYNHCIIPTFYIDN